MTNRKQALDTLDPRWTARIYGKTTGEDFLGLGAVSTNIVGYLLPGIITITPRARYYAFRSWLLTEYGEQHPEGMPLAAFVRRREQIFALANLVWTAGADDRPHQGGLLGTVKLSRHLNECKFVGRAQAVNPHRHRFDPRKQSWYNPRSRTQTRAG